MGGMSAGQGPGRKPGLGAAAKGQEEASPLDRAVWSFREWAGDESSARGHPVVGDAMLCCVFFFNLLKIPLLLVLFIFPLLASLPDGCVPASKCAFQVTRQSTHCGKDGTGCCRCVHLLQPPAALRGTKSFKKHRKHFGESQTQ